MKADHLELCGAASTRTSMTLLGQNHLQMHQEGRN